MTAILAMLRYEGRMLLRDRAAWVTAAFLALVFALAATNGARWVRFQSDTIDRARAEEAGRLSAAGSLAAEIHAGTKAAPRGWWNNPADVRGFAYSQLNTYAVKPAAPLAAFAVGQSDLLPFYFRLNGTAQLNGLTAAEVDNPRRLLLGPFDLAFAVIVVLPLVLLTLCSDIVTADRREGRRALLIAHGATPRRLALVRIALRIAFVLAVVGATLVAAFPLLRWPAAGASDSAPLGSLLAVAGAYAAFWLAIILVVVARARSWSSAALTLVSAWVVLVILLPWSLNLAANVANPLPSRVEYILAMRTANDAVEHDARRRALLTQYLEDHPELAPANARTDSMHYTASNIATREEVERHLRPVQLRFEHQLARQQALIDRWQWLSPAVLAQQAFNELSGSGWSRHRSFVAQVNDYIGELRAFFNPRVLSGRFAFTEFDRWPRFQWIEPDRREQDRRVRAALTGLLIPALVLGLVALRRFA